MVVDDADTLQIGIDKRRAEELETVLLQVLGYLVGQFARGEPFSFDVPTVDNGLAVGKAPDVFVEAAVLFSYPDIASGIGDNCLYLSA